MSAFRIILWIAFLASAVFFQVQSHKFEKADVPDIENFEYASAEEAAKIRATWQDSGLLTTAVNTIRFDFFFIVVYLMLMIGCSNDQMTVEKWRPLNHILRLNIFLALIAASLDLTENFFFLHNVNATEDHIHSYWVTLIKFCVAYWVAGVWALSRLKSLILG